MGKTGARTRRTAARSPGLRIVQSPVGIRAGQFPVLLCKVERRFAVSGPRPDVRPGVEAGLHVPGTGSFEKGRRIPVRAIRVGESGTRDGRGQDRGKTERLQHRVPVFRASCKTAGSSAPTGPMTEQDCRGLPERTRSSHHPSAISRGRARAAMASPRQNCSRRRVSARFSGLRRLAKITASAMVSGLGRFAGPWPVRVVHASSSKPRSLWRWFGFSTGQRGMTLTPGPGPIDSGRGVAPPWPGARPHEGSGRGSMPPRSTVAGGPVHHAPVVRPETRLPHRDSREPGAT